jgi:hypothetical protein
MSRLNDFAKAACAAGIFAKREAGGFPFSPSAAVQNYGDVFQVPLLAKEGVMGRSRRGVSNLP